MARVALLGRESERARIDALLEAAKRGRTGVLVVSGEPGIGKTALLDDACADAAGMRVMRVTGVEAEATLPFAGLDALLRPLVGLLSRLEDPQERALRVALALSEGAEPDPLAVAAGALAVLAEASDARPLLVVVDDVHWLDRASANALAFAARRLEGEELAFLVSARSDDASAFDHGFERIELQPLAPADARDLLTRRHEPLPSGAVERMLDLAAGNPLALLELPAVFASGARGHGVTPTERVRRAFTARLETLPATSRQALLLAAAEPDPVAVRGAAEVLGLDDEALGAAEAAGLVRVAPDGVAFRHPLVRSLAYASADPADQRAAHRALAGALTGEADRDRRAWHLAAAAIEPDEELAALLEETADRATARGGHAAAARALERAARLSREGDAVSRRLSRAARATFWAGDVDHAVALAEEALAATEDPLLRADALLEHASIHPMRGTGYDEESLLALIGELEQIDPDRATRLLMAPVALRLEAFDVEGALELAPQLEEVARRAGAWWGPRGLLDVAGAHLMAGDPARSAEILDELADDDAALAAFAGDLIWAERYEQVRRALETTLREGRSSGNRIRVIWNQACLAQLELRLGRLSQARLAAAEAIAVGEAHGVDRWVCIAQSALAGVLAWEGDAAACRRVATEALGTATRARSVADELSTRSALGLLALGLGRADEAVDELLPAARRWHESTFAEPSGVAFVPDLIEAQVQCGRPDEAQIWLGHFGAVATQSNRRWALAAVARCEGLLAEPGHCDEPFERSLSLLESSPLALERARTHLVYGERLRRAGRRRDARSHLRVAHDAFSYVAAEPWARRAASELRATGESVGPRTPHRKAQLTPQELQIAQLVADGRTNKEIAAQLYLSPKTIESHLAKTYRKLDIHSRAELARIVTVQAELAAPDEAEPVVPSSVD